MDGVPVDGFTVEVRAGLVVLILDNRYGDGDLYEFPPADALRIGAALINAAFDAP